MAAIPPKDRESPIDALLRAARVSPPTEARVSELSPDTLKKFLPIVATWVENFRKHEQILSKKATEIEADLKRNESGLTDLDSRIEKQRARILEYQTAYQKATAQCSNFDTDYEKLQRDSGLTADTLKIMLPTLKAKLKESATQKQTLFSALHAARVTLKQSEDSRPAALVQIEKIKETFTRCQQELQKVREQREEKERDYRMLSGGRKVPSSPVVPQRASPPPKTPAQKRTTQQREASVVVVPPPPKRTAIKAPTLFNEIYPAGTEVYYEKRKGIIQSFNESTGQFAVRFDQNEVLHLDKTQLRYLPKVGHKCLVRDIRDKACRYYKAEIVRIERDPSDPANNSKTPQVWLRWMDYGYEASVELRGLNSILPIDPNGPITAKMAQEPVVSEWDPTKEGTGFSFKRE